MSRRVERPWSRHYQDAWEDRAGNPSLPKWLRVAAVAYGGHRANGHCPLGVGDLAEALAVYDEATGEFVVPDHSNTKRAVRTAIEYGFIHASSTPRCLVVTGAVEGGIGSPYASCPVHGVVSE